MLRALIFTASLAAALPQNIDFSVVEEAPSVAQGPTVEAVEEVPTYDPAVAVASAVAELEADPIVQAEKRSLQARAACAVQPDGFGPTTRRPDTASAFLSNPVYSQLSTAATAPAGYKQVFTNLQGSTQQNGYMGLYTLKNYDPAECKQRCDKASGCLGFNLYIERDPSVDPGTGCTDPPSITNFKCTLYGLPVAKETATNKGQYRNKFQVVITGSNGYNKDEVSPIPGYKGPVILPGAINAPLDNGVDTYLGSRMYPGPYTPSLCEAACTGTTTYDREHPEADGTYKPCNFFNSYILYKNKAPLGTYCSMYTREWSKAEATNTGQYDGEGNKFTVGSSYVFTADPLDDGVVDGAEEDFAPEPIARGPVRKVIIV